MTFPTQHEHIGDGVYAHHDGYHIILTLDNQNNNSRIALEPGLLQILISYEADIIKQVHQDQEDYVSTGHIENH